ncbi:MAG: YibE/F family protein [Jiangellaceae bacterium]|nr:YibE/F family protein [Jiangellaceae bacterium]
MARAQHAGETGLPSVPAVRRTVVLVLLPLIAATVAGVGLLWPSGDLPAIEGARRADATILDIRECAAADAGAANQCIEATVRIDSGPDERTEVVVPVPFGEGAPEFDEGDRVVVGAARDAAIDSRYELLEFQRAKPLLVLAVIFGLAVVALSHWRGLTALASLGFSIVVLIVFVLPSLLDGNPPLAVAVVGASAIMIGTLYVSYGVSLRTSVALLGTLVSLTLTGMLGLLFTAAGRFTGLADDSAAYLGAVGESIDVRGLLLAGLVIGALGVLDDVTVTQTAAVWELADADPTASRRTLFAAGLRIGREHVSATVNTLVLAYAGASLPLLLLFAVSGQGVLDTVTTELVAQEVVRALVGGLGIIAAVPVTTLVAALAVRERPRLRSRRANAAVPVSAAVDAQGR